MKTLTIKNPWAHLICANIKDIENRTWKTNFRGKVLIHTSAKTAGSAKELLTPEQFEIARLKTEGKFLILHPSAIIGSVEIVDCVPDSKSIWAEPCGWHWVLKNPVLFDKPILGVKGKLSFWEYNENQNFTCPITYKQFYGVKSIIM